VTRTVSAQTSSALLLVLTAERLFAIHGIDGVSLRQIAAEAGSANNSAVRYHFGTKAGLITAIFEHRLPQIIGERRLLVGRCTPGDVRSRLEAQMLPLLAMAESPDNRYVSFVEQLQRQVGRAVADDLPELPTTGQESNDTFHNDMRDLIDGLPEPLRTLRINQAQVFCLHAAADRERAIAAGTTTVAFDLFVDALLDGVTGHLTAPASDRTMQHLHGASWSADPSHQLL
jgi:AcrR family transcriptional regulator